MEKILILSSTLKEVIWGGDYFKKELKLTESDAKYGEMWSCSGHPGGLSCVLNGKFKGMPLNKVFKENRHLFNNSTLNEFPILVKVIATSDRLSVQVHPDDEYAQKNENQYGKTEGWLILEAKDTSSIVLGHNAKNKEELIEYVNNDNFDGLLKTRHVKKGEFYPIPSGTIHALGSDLVLLEIQQSSDVTYRFYDYHRKDASGKERQLHIQQAIDVTDYAAYKEKIINCFEQESTTMWDNQFFTIYYQEIKNYFTINNNNNYCIVSVIDGEIKVLDHIIKKGESFIVTSSTNSIELVGNGKVVITYSKQ